ncbi:dehydratase [Rhodococcus sp. ABRD24]|uniref:MaoC/PaaZ C-terminal domain-containing protein n=1 Tax=Rhodococcus sp. ABRD24 TaxID=2507582 RepID=UPI00103CC44F|nr:MaoC/PaaZ C-terminal domain-containing protein [Rhodococcus sp. ABRD24]QBJ98001.1 dehydratase [Rhodococcus sp. ABRD24]
MTLRSDTVTVTQAVIDAFAEITGDRQDIHVHPDRAAAGSTIAHGMLVASLIPALVADLVDVTPPVRDFLAQHPNHEVINLGLSRLAFAFPVPADGRIYADAAVSDRNIDHGGDTLDVGVDVTVWVEGPRPRLAASTLMKLRYREASP